MVRITLRKQAHCYGSSTTAEHLLTMIAHQRSIDLGKGHHFEYGSAVTLDATTTIVTFFIRDTSLKVFDLSIQSER